MRGELLGRGAFATVLRQEEGEEHMSGARLQIESVRIKQTSELRHALVHATRQDLALCDFLSRCERITRPLCAM